MDTSGVVFFWLASCVACFFLGLYSARREIAARFGLTLRQFYERFEKGRLE